MAPRSEIQSDVQKAIDVFMQRRQDVVGTSVSCAPVSGALHRGTLCSVCEVLKRLIQMICEMGSAPSTPTSF